MQVVLYPKNNNPDQDSDPTAGFASPLLQRNCLLALASVVQGSRANQDAGLAAGALPLLVAMAREERNDEVRVEGGMYPIVHLCIHACDLMMRTLRPGASRLLVDDPGW